MTFCLDFVTFVSSSEPARKELTGLDVATIVAVFDRCFADQRTVLVAGAEEPLYEPWVADRPARIHFRADYRSSALHEVAHWCIAGAQRRRQVDFGYWYAPDGRDADQQAAFERVEVRPQAVEWFLHLACGSRFHLSLDNLDGQVDDGRRFAAAVVAMADDCRQHGLPPRAGRFVEALVAAWPPGAWAVADFRPELTQLAP